MSANRIKLRVEPELTPVRMDDRLDLNAEIKVKVDSQLTGLGVFGLALIGLATLLLLAGCILFSTAFPDKWYAQTVGYDTSRDIIRATVLLVGGGVVALLVGTSAYFYGRTVLGSGSLDAFRMQESLQESQEAQA